MKGCWGWDGDEAENESETKGGGWKIETRKRVKWEKKAGNRDNRKKKTLPE